MTEEQIQNIAIAKLEEGGYAYWIPPRVWGERDIFGVFDFIAAKRGKSYLVQITSLQHLSDRRKKIQNWLAAQDLWLNNCAIWAYNKKLGKFKVERVFRVGQPTLGDSVGANLPDIRASL